MNKDRKRIQASQKKELAQQLEALGFLVRLKTKAIHIYNQHTSQWVACLRYLPKNQFREAGWQLEIVSMDVRTEKDLETALQEIKRTQQARQDSEEAWNQYNQSKSNKRWQTYRGTLIANILRLNRPIRETTNEPNSR